MAAGSISGDEFVKVAHDFLVLAEKTKDLWKIKEIPVRIIKCQYTLTWKLFVLFLVAATPSLSPNFRYIRNTLHLTYECSENELFCSGVSQ